MTVLFRASALLPAASSAVPSWPVDGVESCDFIHQKGDPVTAVADGVHWQHGAAPCVAHSSPWELAAAGDGECLRLSPHRTSGTIREGTCCVVRARVCCCWVKSSIVGHLSSTRLQVTMGTGGKCARRVCSCHDLCARSASVVRRRGMNGRQSAGISSLPLCFVFPFSSSFHLFPSLSLSLPSPHSLSPPPCLLVFSLPLVDRQLCTFLTGE